MKFILRTLLAILLFLVGVFSILCILVSLDSIKNSVINLVHSSSANEGAVYIGEIIAFIIFAVIAYFSIRTGIRILKKSKKMKLEPDDSLEILDDLV